MKKIVVIIVALVIVGAGLTIASRTSLPGDPLYGIKVHVWESFNRKTGNDEVSLEDSAERFKARLNEAQQLIVNRNLSTTTATILQEQMTQQVIDLRNAVEAEEANPVTALVVTVDAASVASAIDALTYKEVPDDIQAEFGNIMEELNNVEWTARERLVAAGTTTVETYFSEQVTAISEALETDLFVPRDAMRVLTFIERANTALQDGLLDRTVAFINEAKKAANDRIFLQLPEVDEQPEIDTTPGQG